MYGQGLDIYILQDVIKDKDTSIRKYEQEVESLSFRNQQLASRVEVLQGELENVAHSAKKSKVSVYPLKPVSWYMYFQDQVV